MKRVALAALLLVPAACGNDAMPTESAAPAKRVVTPDGGLDLSDVAEPHAIPTTIRVRARTRPPRGTPRAGDLLDAIARCESRGDPRATSSTGRFRGAFQFDQRTWEANGGAGDPRDATYAEQKAVAATLLARRGVQPWPACGRLATR